MGSITMSIDAGSLQSVLDELEFEGKLPAAATRALTAGAEVVLREAQARAPVRTGELKGKLRVGKRAKSRSQYEIEVGTFDGEAPHAILVERGHGGPKPAAPHPFLAPAADAVADEVTDIIMRELMASL